MFLVKNKSNDEISEINVTPFIDIMLVLLIIFMVVAPLVTSSIKIELPNGVANKVDKEKPIILFIQDNELALNEKIITLSELDYELDKLSNKNKEQIIYFHIDKNVNYERIVKVMNEVKNANYEKIALSVKLNQ